VRKRDLEDWMPSEELCQLSVKNQEAKRILEKLRLKLAEHFGVTVVGPHVTIRFGEGNALICVSMTAFSITDSRIREPVPEDK
jgi:hypothetical protein